MDHRFLQFFVVLLLAHLTADFLLQTKSLVKKKKRLSWLALHSLLNGAAIYLALGCWRGWVLPLVVFLTHCAVDGLKNRLNRDKLWMFALDQAYHLLILSLAAAFLVLARAPLPYWYQPAFEAGKLILALGIGMLLLLPAGGLLIGYFVKPFQDQIRDYYKKNAKKPMEGLANGGKIIGFLERALILVFVLANQFAGIGFLVAAKSIFRFGEFKESENRKEAEYIIIGTFASYLFAIVVSLGVRYLLSAL